MLLAFGQTLGAGAASSLGEGDFSKGSVDVLEREEEEEEHREEEMDNEEDVMTEGVGEGETPGLWMIRPDRTSSLYLGHALQ